METVTIPKDEYNQLKKIAKKLQLIDETIHDEISINDIMVVQEKQESLDFLKNEKEDVYTVDDIKKE